LSFNPRYNHYVQSYELEEHMLHCEHRLLKEANKRMWESKLLKN